MLEDARQGGCSGCIEVGAFGKDAYLLTGYLNVPKILEVTLLKVARRTDHFLYDLKLMDSTKAAFVTGLAGEKKTVNLLPYVLKRKRSGVLLRKR